MQSGVVTEHFYQTMSQWPSHSLQRTAAGHRSCNQRVSWPPSLSLGR